MTETQKKFNEAKELADEFTKDYLVIAYGEYVYGAFKEFGDTIDQINSLMDSVIFNDAMPEKPYSYGRELTAKEIKLWANQVQSWEKIQRKEKLLTKKFEQLLEDVRENYREYLKEISGLNGLPVPDNVKDELYHRAKEESDSSEDLFNRLDRYVDLAKMILGLPRGA